MPPPNKKRRVMPAPKLKGPRPEEISFDLSARAEYLTGFHKRKVERTKAAQEAAERRAKEEKRVQRNKLREERKRDLEERVKVVDAYMRPTQPEDQESAEESGDSDDSDTDDMDKVYEPPEKVDHEAEYVDEDKYTSVVVEEVDVDRDGFVNADDSGIARKLSSSEGEEQAAQTKGTEAKATTKRQWTHNRPRDAASKPKQKRKKFRYESKAERKLERGKQKAKNSKQAKARRAQ